MSLSQDDLYDQRGLKFASSQGTMNCIITYAGGFIYLGGMWAAFDLKLMREKNIGLVINCISSKATPNWAGQPDTPALAVMAVGDEVYSAM